MANSLIKGQIKRGLLRREQKRLAEEAALSGEFIPNSSTLPTNMGGQVNPNVRPPVDGEVVQPPAGLLGAPPVPPNSIDPKTGFPYGKAAAAGGVIAGGGLLASMDSGEGSANANPNLTPEQIKADQDGQAQMQKDAQDIKSGAATPEQLLRATNFQQREAAAAGNEIQEISKPEGIEQGFWDKLGGQFDMTSVGLALMASSGNGQPLGANLGKALQVGVMSAESKKALTKAEQSKADSEAKREKIRTDALALAADKYTATQAQQAIVNKREQDKVDISRTKAVIAEMSAQNKLNQAKLKADKKSTKTPTRGEQMEVTAMVESKYGVTLDESDSKDRHTLINILYEVRNNLPTEHTLEQKQAAIDKSIGIRFDDNWRNSVEADPVRQQQTLQQTPPAGTIMINGVPVTRN